MKALLGLTVRWKLMKGKFVLKLKKWWLTALVFTLVLPLVSCSKKRKETLQADYGFTQCDGTIGSFDVYVIRSKTNPGTFEISIITIQADAPGDIASITVANSSKAYKQLIPQVVLNNDQEIFGGYLTESELNQYDILAITPYDPSTNFADQVSAKDALCTLPLPGDGVNPDDYSPQPQ
jgi:hypothetical protein